MPQTIRSSGRVSNNYNFRAVRSVNDIFIYLQQLYWDMKIPITSVLTNIQLLTILLQSGIYVQGRKKCCIAIKDQCK